MTRDPIKSRGPPNMHRIRVCDLTTHTCSSPCSVCYRYINAQVPVPAHGHVLGCGGLPFQGPLYKARPTFKWLSAVIIGKLLGKHGITDTKTRKLSALQRGKDEFWDTGESLMLPGIGERKRSSRSWWKIEQR